MPSPSWSDKNVYETTTKDTAHALCKKRPWIL